MNTHNKTLLGLLLLFIMISCQNEELERLRKDQELSMFKITLLKSKDEQIPISKIETQPNLMTIHFEDESSVTINSNWVTSVNFDSITWQASFDLSDASKATAFFIGKLEESNINVSRDPFSRSPLTAVAKIHTPIKGKFRMKVHKKGETGVAIIKNFNMVSDYHEVPILGLYPNHINQVEFTFMSPSGIFRTSKILTVATEPIPTQIKPEINILKRTSFDDEGLYFVSNLALAYDQNGDVRWYFNRSQTDFGDIISKLKNGNMLIGSTVGQLSYHPLEFYEIEMTGRIVKRYTVPNRFHHEIIEIPSGNLLAASNSHEYVLGHDGKPQEDAIFEIDRVTGTIVKSWDFNAILDPFREFLPDTDQEDWLHINSIFFDQRDNSLIVSGRSQSVVCKVDYQTGQLKWIFANPLGWREDLKSFLLTPTNLSTDFWTYGQHAAKVIPNGNLIIYDNGDYRNFYDDKNSPQISYSRLVEYKINESSKNVELIWHFSYNKELFTYYTGWVDFLDNQNYLIAYMFGPGPGVPRILEVDRNGEIKFESTINTATPFYYRGYKFDLY